MKKTNLVSVWAILIYICIAAASFSIGAYIGEITTHKETVLTDYEPVEGYLLFKPDSADLEDLKWGTSITFIEDSSSIPGITEITITIKLSK